MKVKADELCPRCRDIPWGNGKTLEEMLNILHNDDRFKNMDDDEFNAAAFAALYKYSDEWHCTMCWQLIFDRLPDYMKRRR